MFEDLKQNERIVTSGQQSGQDGLVEEFGGLEHTEVLPCRVIHEGGKLGEKVRLKDHDIQKSRIDEQFHLRGSGMIKAMDLEMAFPGFKDDFDAPTHPVDPAHCPGIPNFPGNVGEKDLPSKKGQMGWIRIEPFVSTVEQFSPSFAGNRLGDGNCHYPHGESFLGAGMEGLVKSSMSSQALEQIKAFAGGVEESYLMGVATQVESSFLTNVPEDTKGRVAQVADDQISLLDNAQYGRRGALVVAPGGSELKRDKCLGEGVVDGLKFH